MTFPFGSGLNIFFPQFSKHGPRNLLKQVGCRFLAEIQETKKHLVAISMCSWHLSTASQNKKNSFPTRNHFLAQSAGWHLLLLRCFQCLRVISRAFLASGWTTEWPILQIFGCLLNKSYYSPARFPHLASNRAQGCEHKATGNSIATSSVSELYMDLQSKDWAPSYSLHFSCFILQWIPGIHSKDGAQQRFFSSQSKDLHQDLLKISVQGLPGNSAVNIPILIFLTIFKEEKRQENHNKKKLMWLKQG